MRYSYIIYALSLNDDRCISRRKKAKFSSDSTVETSQTATMTTTTTRSYNGFKWLVVTPIVIAIIKKKRSSLVEDQYSSGAPTMVHSCFSMRPLFSSHSGMAEFLTSNNVYTDLRLYAFKRWKTGPQHTHTHICAGLLRPTLHMQVLKYGIAPHPASCCTLVHALCQ